jgi:hypothetical protein
MSRRLLCGRALSLATLAGLACSPAALAQGPFADSLQLNLSSITLPGVNRSDIPAAITNDGEVFGYSSATVENSDATPAFLVSYATWRARQDGSVASLGLSGPQYIDPVTGAIINIGYAFSPMGMCAGITQRVAGGEDGWFFNGTSTVPVGLTTQQLNLGPEFATLSSYPSQLSPNGTLIGTAIAQRNDGQVVNFPFYSTGTSTIPLGLSGPQYIWSTTGTSYGDVADISPSGKAVGQSYRFDGARSFAADAWIFDGTSYTQIGLYTPDFQNVETGFLARNQAVTIADTDTGVIVGGAAQPLEGSSATGAWIYRDGVTTEVGLTGPGTLGFFGNRNSFVNEVFSTGAAIGYTQLLGSADNNGNNYVSWYWRDGQTVKLGLEGPQHIDPVSGREYQTISSNTPGGIVWGNSLRADIDDNNIFLAGSAWFANINDSSPTATQLGLFTAPFTGAVGENYSVITDADDAGFITGLSYRYDSAFDNFPSTAWIYNIATREYTIIPAPTASDGFTRTIPLNITPFGGVFGVFSDVDESGAVIGNRAFYFSPRAGFVNLTPNSVFDVDPLSIPVVVSPDGRRVAIELRTLNGDPALLRLRELGDTAVCDSLDFNADSLFPDTQDINDFLSVFAGGPCAAPNPANCNTDIDFNNDGLFPDTADIDSLLSVFSGGSC